MQDLMIRKRCSHKVDVFLEYSGPPSQKIWMIKALRLVSSQINENDRMGLKEAKDLVEAAPVVIWRSIHRKKAMQAKKELEAIGARVQII